MKLDDYEILSVLLTKLRYEVIESISEDDTKEDRETIDKILDAICIVQNVMIVGEEYEINDK